MSTICADADGILVEDQEYKHRWSLTNRENFDGRAQRVRHATLPSSNSVLPNPVY